MERTLLLLNALSNRTRFKIVDFLLDGEKCVCEIFPYVNRTQSTTSIQLRKLVDAGILDFRKEGKKIFYRIIDYNVCGIFKTLNYANKKVYSENCCKC